MKVTDCQCEQPGWCPRHQCMKGKYWFAFCRRSTRLFDAWEKGHGPGQQVERQSIQAVIKTPCRHLGDPLREETCPTCKGLTRLKVFHCALHAECTLGRPLDRMACCASCVDYQPPELASHSLP